MNNYYCTNILSVIRFLKEEPSKLENLVSRCKHITGTLFTLQK